jgi:hypothetical protein
VSKAKQKGTAAETAVVRYLRGINTSPLGQPFPNVERRALSGGKDMGDIAGIPGTVIEIKAAERLELAKWQRETLTEKANANANLCLLIVKRKYKPVHQWDAYVPARQLGYPSSFMPEGEEWVRMDLVLAVAYLALQVNL